LIGDYKHSLCRGGSEKGERAKLDRDKVAKHHSHNIKGVFYLAKCMVAIWNKYIDTQCTKHTRMRSIASMGSGGTPQEILKIMLCKGTSKNFLSSFFRGIL